MVPAARPARPVDHGDEAGVVRMAVHLGMDEGPVRILGGAARDAREQRFRERQQT
ncbi:hypothetical protein SBADM41S_10779 [Streptomyces badius]